MSRTTQTAVYELLTSDSDERVCKDIPESACHEEPVNFTSHVMALSGTKIADGLIDPKLVLSWLLTSAGAPAAFVGMLVPVREAGALLPQLFTAGALRRLARRKWAWAAGAAVQGLAAIAMGLAALFLEGTALGVVILVALAALALARSVCSVTYKDVLGKTVSKSRRGTVTGTAGSISAAAVLVFGALLTAGLLPRMDVVTAALFAAGACWIGGAWIFSRLNEEPGATEGGANAFSESLRSFTLLGQDKQLRRFILTRGLLIAIALAPPYMVALGMAAGGEDQKEAFGGLGLLVIASAMGGLLSSYVWGRLADTSSRRVLIFTAAASTAALLLTIALDVSGLLSQVWALPSVLFVLMLAYHGIRVGRSTHLVDMATPDTRAAYTALSNTIIGVLLMLGGIFSWVASAFGEATVIICFAVMSSLAIVTAFGLEEVQQD